MDEAVAWLREQIEAERAYWQRIAATGIQPFTDRATDVATRCEAELAILDEHGPSRRDATRCRVCTAIADGHAARFRAPCPTVRAVASGYRHRAGYAEHWDEALITS